MRVLSAALLLVLGIAWADVVQYEAQFGVTDSGVTHNLDIDNDGQTEPYASLTICNTGDAPVVCLPSGAIPNYSTTDKFPMRIGECRTLPDRVNRGGEYTRVSCITNVGETTTVGVIAQP